MVAVLNWTSLILAILTSTGLLLSRDWRLSLGLLAIQYLSIFWMVQAHWPVSMATVKLVGGWMACAILGTAHLNIRRPKERQEARSSGRFFHVFIAGVILTVTFEVALQIADSLSISLPIAWGGLLLIGLGLLHLGITTQPFRVVLGLLTVLAGFEIIYAAVENSSLVTALLVLVTLGLSMAGAYLLDSAQEEKPA